MSRLVNAGLVRTGLGLGRGRRAAALAAPLLILSLLLSFGARPASAQCTLSSPTTWNIPGNGNFSSPGDWSGGVPNGSTNACLTNGTSTVTLDTSESVASLQLATGNALDFNTNTTLNVDGTQIINAGQITITGGSGSNGILDIGNNVALSGGGTLTLAYSGSGAGQGIIQQNSGGLTLTNVNNTINGLGVIGNGGLALNNESGGTIDANTPIVNGIALTLNGSGGITNGGLLEATSGGTLVITATVTNAGGNITAGNGSTVQINNANIIGGTLNNTGTGTLETIGTSTLNGTGTGGITINGAYTGGTNTQTNVLGTINVNGNMTFTGGNGSNSIMNLTGDTLLSPVSVGSGVVTLAYTGSGAGQGIIQQNSGGITLTNEAEIVGLGVIGNGGLTLHNDAGGIIDANTPIVNGVALTLNGSGGIVNTGLLEATNGGTLVISTPIVDNLFSAQSINPAGVITANGGTVELSGTTIEGGSLNQLNGGILENVGTATLDGSTVANITINGTYTSGTGTTTDVLGMITNNGNMLFTGGNGSNSFLNLTGDATISGGTVTLAYTGSGSGAGIIQQNSGGITLTNESTIQGAGVIGNGGLAVINDATIDANTSGLALTLNGSGGVTNGSLLEATNGGTLVINTTVSNAGGNITAGNGSTVQIDNADIIGGTLNNTGTGTLETVGTSTLDGSTVSGAVTINGTYTGGTNTTTDVHGGIVNNGNMLFTGGNGSNSFLNLTGNTTLSGTGTVTLAYTGSGAGAGIIQQNSGGLTLTNENTIQGTGVIGNGGLTVINSPGGVIDANTTGQTLTVNPGGGLTNTGGLLEASDGGILSLASSTIDNKNGTIEVNGSTSAVQFVNGATIQGGTLTTTGGGSLGVPGGNSITLDGSTQGALTLSTGTMYTAGTNTTTDVHGAIINNGNMEFTGGNGSNSILNLTGSTTLSGTGTVTMAYTGSGAGAAIIQQASGGLTLTNESIIQGAGVIGNGGLTTINSPGGVIDANVSGQTLTLNGGGGTTNTGGTLEASDGGILDIAESTINNGGGTIEVDGSTSAVQFVNGADIEGGTLTTTGGGSLGVPNGSSITLDGTTQGALTLSTGSTFTAGTNTTTDVHGAIVNNGNMEFTGGNGSNSILSLTNNTTLSGTGTVTMAYTGSGAGAAIIQQNSGGLTLTNESTIQGAGVIGNGGLAVTNSPDGVIDANTSGQLLTLNGSGDVTNAGLLEATNGGTLVISTTVNNSGANITANGGTVQLSNAIIQGGTLNSLNGGSLQNIGTATLDGSSQGPLTFSAGTTFTAGTNTTTDITGAITNNGNMLFTGGNGSNSILNLTNNTTLSGTGTLTLAYNGSGAGAAIIQQASGGLTLTNESTIQGTGTIGNGGLAVDNAVGGTIDANVSGRTLTINGGSLTNAGTLEVQSGSTMNLSPGSNAVTNTGTVNVNAGGTMSFASNLDYTQTSGDTKVNGSFGGTGASVNINGGTLEGTGTLTGAVTVASAGTIAPGSLAGPTPGTLGVDGSYMQTAGTFDELIGTTGNSLLDVTGPVTLGGTADLNIDLLSGFSLADGDAFDIMDYSTGDESGAFANAPATGFQQDGWNWDINYDFNGDEVLLTAVSPTGVPTPEPGELLSLAAGLLALGAFYYRRKRVRAQR